MTPANELCSYCGRAAVRRSRSHADYESLLPSLGIARLRCTSCDRRFYRFWGRRAMPAPEAPVNWLRWFAILLLACAGYLLYFFPRR